MKVIQTMGKIDWINTDTRQLVVLGFLIFFLKLQLIWLVIGFCTRWRDYQWQLICHKSKQDVNEVLARFPLKTSHEPSNATIQLSREHWQLSLIWFFYVQRIRASMFFLLFKLQ